MEEKKFFRLLRQSNEMEKNPETPILIAGRIPCLEPEESDILLDSIRTIEDNFHFSEREEYINLAKYFLADQMTADDFSGAFIGTYKGIDEENKLDPLILKISTPRESDLLEQNMKKGNKRKFEERGEYKESKEEVVKVEEVVAEEEEKKGGEVEAEEEHKRKDEEKHKANQ